MLRFSEILRKTTGILASPIRGGGKAVGFDGEFYSLKGRIFSVKSSRWISKLGLVQGSPAASRSPQRAWKRSTSPWKRFCFSGLSSVPRLLLS